MAKYRQVYTEFWRDSFVMRLTPEEKFFYLYLMTNPASKQCGIYELPIQIMAMETGYNQETIVKLLVRFQEYDKVKFDENTSEIALKNWAKYNTNNSPKVAKLVDNELITVKNKALIQYVYGIDTACKAYRNNNNNNNNNNKENENNKSEAEASEVASAPIYDSLLSKSFDIFSKEGIKGVFFERLKNLYQLSDSSISELYLSWLRKKETLGEIFKTEKHLKASFNKHVETNASNIRKSSGKSVEDILALIEDR